MKPCLLSFVIPTFNEEKRIAGTLEALTKFLNARRFNYEIVVVDDGSDSTSEIVRGFAKKNRGVKLIRLERGAGKGGAVKKGLLAARGSEVVVYDADAATPPREIPRLVSALRAYEIAVGVRRKSVGPFYRRLIRRAFNFFVRLLFGWRFRDTQCGFKALRKRAAKKIAREARSNGFEFDVELLAKARKHCFSVVEVPVDWKHVAGGPIERASALKKIVDALRMLAVTIKIKLQT